MADPGALRFTRIRLENWRNFLQVEVALESRVFLIGPNAAGKSNFLDSFKFLRDIASVGGGLQDSVDRRGGVSRVRALSARASSDIGLTVDVGTAENPTVWRYEVKFGSDRKKRAALRAETVWHNGRRIHHRPDKADRADPERLTQTSLEQVNVNRRFRDLAEFFAAVRYLHIVPQLIREPERSVGRRNDPFGGDFLDQVASTPKKTRDARLKRILRAATVAVPQLEELRLEPDAQGAWHLRGKYRHWRAQGAWQTEQDLSDGTLRLFGLLWSVLDAGGPLLLEEPELSLHPEVVRRIPQMFARIQSRLGRQIMLSTHSSDLLEDEGIGLDEVLLLEPKLEGTVIRPAAAFFEIPELLEGGLSLAEAVVPKTRPKDVEQLALFEG
jgi:predicted ATPase